MFIFPAASLAVFFDGFSFQFFRDSVDESLVGGDLRVVWGGVLQRLVVGSVGRRLLDLDDEYAVVVGGVLHFCLTPIFGDILEINYVTINTFLSYLTLTQFNTVLEWF